MVVLINPTWLKSARSQLQQHMFSTRFLPSLLLLLLLCLSPNHWTLTVSPSRDASDTFYMCDCEIPTVGQHDLIRSCRPPSNFPAFRVTSDDVMKRQGHLLPLWALDWLNLSACKSRRRGPGVHWPNYAKHITHLEPWRLGRMKRGREREECGVKKRMLLGQAVESEIRRTGRREGGKMIVRVRNGMELREEASEGKKLKKRTRWTGEKQARVNCA